MSAFLPEAGQGNKQRRAARSDISPSLHSYTTQFYEEK
jgi:hypothetical protein